MKKIRSRFEDAMKQLNIAFDKSELDETTLLKEEPNLQETKQATPTDFIELKENKAAPQKNTDTIIQETKQGQELQKKDFSESLDQAVQKLEQRRQKKTGVSPLSTLEIDSEKQSPVLDNTSDNLSQKPVANNLEYLINKLVQTSISAALQNILKQKLEEVYETDKQVDSNTANFEQDFFSQTPNVLKNRNILLEKFSQYSTIKFDFSVDLGLAKMKFKDLFALQEGDIFPIDANVKDNFVFLVNQKPVGQGKIVNSNNSRGFQVNSFHQYL